MRFRPEDDPRPGGPVEWADNWLSNAFAWGSYRVTPGWCQTETHWTSRLTQFLFTDCPCCLLFRGIACGLLLSAIPWGIVVMLVIAAR
jgi:hypothetical protein